MRKFPKKITRDPLGRRIVEHLKRKGTRCGYGDQMEQIRRLK
ncbi:MAG: hypothetical protein RLZZ188_1995 [Verrucomicrobiota bacterium]